MEKSAIASPVPTPPPNSRTVTQQLRKPLNRRQQVAETCGWAGGISSLPKRCPGEICAFNHGRQLWGCCPLPYLSKPCVLPPICVEYSDYISICNSKNECASTSYTDALICSDPQIPYCATSSYDSAGVTMTSLGCSTTTSSGPPVESFFIIYWGIAGVLADQTTITPSGFTSLATIMNRQFATASLPDFTSSLPGSTSSSSTTASASSTSTSLTVLETSIKASPSSIHSFNDRLSTSVIAGISVAIVVLILSVALGVWYFLRCRKHKKSGTSVPSSQKSIQRGRSPSVGVNDSVSQTGQPTVVEDDNYGRPRLSMTFLQNHENHSTKMPSGLHDGAQENPSDSSQPCHPQPSFLNQYSAA